MKHNRKGAVAAAVLISAMIAVSGCAGKASSGSGSTSQAETAPETLIEETVLEDTELEDTELEEEPDEESEELETAGEADLDTVVSAFLQEAGAGGGSQEENLEAAYRYLLSGSSYLGVGTPDFADGWQEQYALDMFDMKMGNCFSYASAFAAIAKSLGYPAAIASGSCVWGEEELDEHSWVLIDDKVFDPLLEDRLDDGSGQLHFFMTDYDSLKNEQNCTYMMEDEY